MSKERTIPQIQREEGVTYVNAERIKDGERLDFLEKHFDQLYRRGNPDMDGNDIVLSVTIPRLRPQKHRVHCQDVRMAIDQAMKIAKSK